MSSEDSTIRPAGRKSWLSALGFGGRREACAPDGARIYAVGDIHGCDSALDRLHQAIVADAASFQGDKLIVYLGDYVDRGPDSRGVIERLISGVPKGFKAEYIRGNHDQAVLDFLSDPESYRVWRGFGAPETLMSYGVRPPLFDSNEKFEEARQAFEAALPAAHLAFLRSLELYAVHGDYAFVHAGIRPGVSLAQQSEEDLLWIRDEFLGSGARHEKVVVHGHTPVAAPQRMRNRIGVDTGVYVTAVLSCAVLEGTDCRFLQARA